MYNILCFISNLNIFPMISQSDIVSINEWTLILKIISQHEIKHIMMLRIKTMTKGLDIIVIMSVSTFKTAVILLKFKF